MTMSADELRAILRRELEQHREITFHNGKPPKVGLDAGTLLKLVGTMLGVVGLVAGLAIFAFQTKTEAVMQHSAIEASASAQHHRLEQMAAARDAAIEQKAAVSDEVVRRLEHNLRQVGRAVGARGLQSSDQE